MGWKEVQAGWGTTFSREFSGQLKMVLSFSLTLAYSDVV